MIIPRQLLDSCRAFPGKWAQFTDAAFRRAVPDPRDELARGEFISAFISESGLVFPASPQCERPRL